MIMAGTLEAENNVIFISNQMADVKITARNCDSVAKDLQDAATSPSLPLLHQNSSKRKCSHIKSSYCTRRRRSSLGSSAVVYKGHDGTINTHCMKIPRRSRAFSVQSFQSYLFFFWSSPMVTDEFFIEDEDLEDDADEDEFEPGCCNACWDQDVPWCEFRPRSSQSSEYALKFKVFALTFCLLGVGTFSLHKIGDDPLDPHGVFSITGGVIHMLAGLSAILAWYKNAKITLFLQLVFSVTSLIHACVWVLAFQVILVIKNEAIRSLTKDMNRTFPWILSAKYLTAGVGSVMGILSAAMASFAMRELRDIPADETSITRKHSMPMLSTTKVEFPRQLVNPVIIEEKQDDSHMKSLKTDCFKTVTEKSANGMIETSFS